MISSFKAFNGEKTREKATLELQTESQKIIRRSFVATDYDTAQN